MYFLLSTRDSIFTLYATTYTVEKILYRISENTLTGFI